MCDSSRHTIKQFTHVIGGSATVQHLPDSDHTRNLLCCGIIVHCLISVPGAIHSRCYRRVVEIFVSLRCPQVSRLHPTLPPLIWPRVAVSGALFFVPYNGVCKQGLSPMHDDDGDLTQTVYIVTELAMLPQLLTHHAVDAKFDGTHAGSKDLICLQMSTL